MNKKALSELSGNLPELYEKNRAAAHKLGQSLTNRQINSMMETEEGRNELQHRLTSKPFVSVV